MAIESEFVGSLKKGGGGLEWQSKVFPRRTIKWTSDPIEESFTIPGNSNFIAYASAYVFSGGNNTTAVDLRSEEVFGHLDSIISTAETPSKGQYFTGIIGIHSGIKTRKLIGVLKPGYDAPDTAYQISIYWAELPE